MDIIIIIVILIILIIFIILFILIILIIGIIPLVYSTIIITVHPISYIYLITFYWTVESGQPKSIHRNPTDPHTKFTNLTRNLTNINIIEILILDRSLQYYYYYCRLDYS